MSAAHLQKQAHETSKLEHRLEAKEAKLAAQHHEIDALKIQNASINTLGERLAALERKAGTISRAELRSLASNSK
jgi:hypothetical protein